MSRFLFLPVLFFAGLPGLGVETSAAEKDWWAFRELTEVAVPATDVEWGRNAVDAFILERLKREGLSPAPEASREVLARRLFFDLWGLPPSPEDLDAFLQDAAPDSWERLVDRLLDSPRYGENWARYWLDLVRYADSDGYKADDFRPNAWRYRDYVIRSFNADKSYARFVQEQLAGDEIAPGDPDCLIATGYLRQWIYEYNNRDAAGQWNTILNDITDTTADVFMGLGLQCARCHDHKYDPLPQTDYFRLQAFFAGLKPREDLPLVAPEMVQEFQTKQAEWERQTAEIRAKIEEIEARHRQRAEEEAVAKFPEETQAILRKPEADRTPWEKQVGALAYRQVTYEFDRLEAKIKGTDKETWVNLRKELAKFDQLRPEPLPKGDVATDWGREVAPIRIPQKDGAGEIAPGFPAILQESPARIEPLETSSGRRKALAEWLTDPKNPLTARVMVNRVWQWHFGKGLSTTASDFGKLGEPPSHPELLDWLAWKFVQDGWSLKKLHRLILTSATWKQSAVSPHGEIALAKDPHNRLLWRWSTRRLQAEQIRDALLTTTGEISLDAGGPPVDFSKPRRSIFNKVLRNTRDPILDVFDAPQHFNSTAARDTTTTAIQSLLLVNSRYLLDRAGEFASRLEKQHPNDRSRQIEAAYRLAYGRFPRSTEKLAAEAFLDSQQSLIPPDPPENAEFIAESMPQRAGKAALLAPGSGQEKLFGPPPALNGDFSVEAVALLRSLHENGEVRVLASAWEGDKAKSGWALGITGKKSQRKPSILVLQMVGEGADGVKRYEPIFSDLQIQLDRSYYLAASLHFDPAGRSSVTFFVKDLANDDEPLQSTVVTHPIARCQPDSSLVFGGLSGPGHQWDGLLDEFRLRHGIISAEEVFYVKTDPKPSQIVAQWEFEAQPGYLHESVSGELSLKTASLPPRPAPKQLALQDFCHALLNSSEFLYVE